MREFTQTLHTIMSVVSNQLELLPASEGAVEEMTYVDEEERDDTRLSGDHLLVETSLEIPKPTWKYRALQPIERSKNHFFRYFLDGSYKHYFLATGLEHDRATPIFLAQIAIVILERDDEGKLSIVPDFKRHQWFLLLAKSRISDAAWERIQESTKEAKVNIIIKDLAEMDAFSGDYQEAQDLRVRGRSKTRHVMSTMEFDIVHEFRTKVHDHWMIKDGLVSFGKPPMTRFHERSGINFRRFDGTVALSGARNNERMDETKEAPLPLVIEQTFQLIQTQIGVSRKLRDLFFEERPEYPTFAWQEAIINAVAHRDYSLRGNEIEVRMFDDRLETKSPGLPPEPVTIEELRERKAVHASRNPRIMRVLKAFGFVRERGEGLPRVFEEIEESCLPAPVIVSEGRFFKIVFRNTPVFDEATMVWLKGFPLEKLNVRQRRILAYSFQSGKGYFVLRDYARENKLEKEDAKKEVRQLVKQGAVEIVGNRKAAKYYPLLQKGTVDEKLREYFSRHESMKNADYRMLAGKVHRLTALRQLKDLEQRGLLRKEGKGKGTRYFPAGELLKNS